MVYIKPINAKIVRDVVSDLMSPYCDLKIGDISLESSESSGDKNPNWNEQLSFHVKPGDNYLEITLKDKKTLQRDKTIGAAILPLVKLYATKCQEEWIELLYDGQLAGHIMLQMQFNPEEGPESIKEPEVKKVEFESKEFKDEGLKDIPISKEQKEPVKQGAVGEQFSELQHEIR